MRHFRYDKVERMVRVFDGYGVPPLLRARIADLVAKHYRAGFRDKALLERVMDDLRRDSQSSRYKAIDWDKLLPILLEILKLVIPLIIALI